MLGSFKPKHPYPMSRKRPEASKPKSVVPSTQPSSTHTKSPFWLNRLFLGERHAVLWAAIGVLVAIIAIVVGYLVPWKIQSHVEASNLSKITYAVSIMPNPQTSEFSNTPNYWISTIQLWNTGPATAKTVVLHLNAPPPFIFFNSSPTLTSAPASGEVKINERIPRGIYEVVLRNFPPGEFCEVRMEYHAEGEIATKIRDDWKNDGLRSAIFAKNFISEFWFSGENLSAENWGMLDVQQTYPLR